MSFEIKFEKGKHCKHKLTRKIKIRSNEIWFESLFNIQSCRRRREISFQLEAELHKVAEIFVRHNPPSWIERVLWDKKRSC